MKLANRLNTEFEYLYRDASNYKWSKSVVLSGTLKLDDLKKLLIDSEFFIPELVGMESLTPEIRTEDDHDWHEAFALRPTPVPANFISAKELLKRFQTQHSSKWHYLPKGKRYG